MHVVAGVGRRGRAATGVGAWRRTGAGRGIEEEAGGAAPAC
jgi:hypothetical protein